MKNGPFPLGFSTRLFWIVFLLASLTFVHGCANYQLRMEDSAPDKKPYESKTIHAYVWGKFYDPQQIVADCRAGKGINDVVIKRNYLHDLAGVLTLGFWMPLDVEYRCQAAAPKDLGEL